MLVCGTTPCSRCCLCHTPPWARSGVLSSAAPWPCSAHGFKTCTRCRPKQPINAGSVLGKRCNRRSQVRRLGKRPCSLSRHRNCCTSGSAWSRKRSNAHAVYRRTPNDHDHQRFQEQSIRVGYRATTRALGRGWGYRNAVNHLYQADQQTLTQYHCPTSISRVGSSPYAYGGSRALVLARARLFTRKSCCYDL